MPPPAYTRRLLGGYIPSDTTPLTAGPVPDGEEWVVTCISCVTTFDVGIFTFLQVSPGNEYIASFPHESGAGLFTLITHQVVEPGESLVASTTSPTPGDISILVTGYVLSLT